MNLYDSYISGTLTVSGAIVPSANLAFDLGTTSNNFRHLYVGSGSIYMGGNKILGLNSDGSILLGTQTIQTSASFAAGSTSNTFTGSVIVSGSLNVSNNLIVTGSITAQQYIISSSVTYLTESFASGSHKFGDTIDDTHQFTGSVLVTGSANINGNTTITGSLTTTGNIIAGSTIQNTYHYLNSYTGSGTQLIGVVGSNSNGNGGYMKVITDTAAGGVRGIRLGLNGNGTQPGNGNDVLTVSDSAFVGIGVGKTSPNTNLDVTGSMLISGSGVLATTFQQTITSNGTYRLMLGAHSSAGEVQSAGSVPLYLNYGGNKTSINGSGVDNILLGTINDNGAGKVQVSGSIVPSVSSAFDLGTATYRWGTVYTSDLSLNNGIGDWTIVEGEDDLFLYNNKKGKVYKFALTEVDPSVATPKMS